jgi:hypothetical protein
MEILTMTYESIPSVQQKQKYKGSVHNEYAPHHAIKQCFYLQVVEISP